MRRALCYSSGSVPMPETCFENHITKHSWKLIEGEELKWLTKARSQVLFTVIPSPFLLPEAGGEMHFLPQPQLKACICFASAKYFMEQLL